MKKTFCSLFSAASLLVSSAAIAAETSLDATTILRIERRSVSGSSTQDIMPATQFLNLDVNKLGDGNLSLHLSGWGRVDLADKSYNTDRADGNLTYGYLQYRFTHANADIRAGRLFVHEGIVNEHVDGLALRTDLPLGFGISAFGGATVHTRHLWGQTSDGKGDGIVGGRINYRHEGLLEIGVSAVGESKAPLLANYASPVQAPPNGDIRSNHRLAGGDIWFSPYRFMEIIGHSSYNIETHKMAEHAYLLNLKPLQQLVLSGEFNEYRDRSYLYAWSLFSGSALNPADRSRSVGGIASYDFNKTVGLTADYRHYTRQLGNADRYGADLRLSFLNNRVRSGLGYHYLRAGQNFAIASNTSASYHSLRAYALHDTKTYFAAVDAIDYIFKNKVYDEKHAWEGTLSLGYHLTPALALSGDISYGRNPEFTEDLRGLLRLTYNMNFDGKGGK
ncbi:hypothetical protein [Pelotalea chapellei]|uniref:Uncharacterized protein n=1 Tax=Pelotalea chapellei TaxID=44671 RepID=A0ABS5U5N7_9BACT|nr:hypothetical protein [Pelotalea chapellei]MBT1070980.1 hypothetical protein [Pelotalea chapellei]